MTIRELLLNLGKLLLCGIAFSVGIVLGGMIARVLQLPPPTVPANIDVSATMTYFFLESPVVALVLALIARGLGGRFQERAAALSFFTWIAYTVNNQLEASIFTSMAGSLWFSLISFLVPALLCGAAVAFLFPPAARGTGQGSVLGAFFDARSARSWLWRLALAAVAFMPIYYFFGLLVVPFTAEYYRQNMFGLQMPPLEQILQILFVRSVLFLCACLPVLILWQGSSRSLVLRLGFALFVLVGLLYMVVATWMPLTVRLPHTLEILADEFVYAAVLVLLLARGDTAARQEVRLMAKSLTG